MTNAATTANNSPATADSFDRIRLGGNLWAMSYIDESGNEVVWFPAGQTDDGEAAVAIYDECDEEWESPVLWKPAADLQAACDVINSATL
jgi:hypothetical protein